MTTPAASARREQHDGPVPSREAPHAAGDTGGNGGRARVVVWLVPVVALVAGIWAIGPFPVGVMSDDAMYVILAKSLATGRGYRYLNLPGAPPATHFPPGYPALLAMLWRLGPTFPRNVLLFKLANACLLAVIAASTARFARVRLGFTRPGAATFALAVTLSIPMLVLSSLVMSEVLFLALVLPALLLAERIVDGQLGVRYLVLFAVLAGTATLVRTLGVALIAAAMVGLVMRRRAPAALVCGAAAAVVIAPWLWWTHVHTGIVPAPMREAYDSYGAWLGDSFRAEGIGLLGRTIARTSRLSVDTIAMLLVPLVSGVLRAPAMLLLGTISAIGARRLWRDARVGALFLAMYMGLVLACPVLPMRYVFGVWPLVMALTVLGARDVLHWHPAPLLRRVVRGGLLAAAALLGVAFGTYNVVGYHRRSWEDVSRRNGGWLRPLVIGTRAHTPPGEVLAATAEGATYLYTDHVAVPAYGLAAWQFFRDPTTAENAAALRGILAAYPVGAVVASSRTTRGGAEVLAGLEPPELVMRDSFPGSVIYGVVHR